VKRIGEYLEEYIRHLESRNMSPRTVSLRSRMIREFIGVTGLTSIEELVPDRLAAYQRTLAGRGLARSTVIVKLTSLRGFLEFLKERNLCLLEGSVHLGIPRGGRYLPRAVLTEGEVRRILALPDLARPAGMRLRAIMEILYGTGIRKSELLNLALQDLDLRERSLLVRQGKGAVDRLLPVPRRTVGHVRAYIATRRGGLKRRTRRLFLNARDGSAMSDACLQAVMRELGRRARKELGIEKPVTCHVFRHSIASHLLARGLDIRFIQAFLGHAQLASTQIYTRVVRKHASREVQRRHPREKMKIPF